MALIDNLVSYWKLDEASGTSAADSKGSNTGTVVGTEAWVAGKLGGAFDFNGSTNRIGVGTSDTLNLTSALTIAAWINPDGLGETSQGRIFDRYSTSGYAFYVASSTGNKLRFIGGSTVTGTTDFNLAEWSHVAITISGTTYTFYINGTAGGTGSLTAIVSTAGITGAIGSRAAGDRDFNGEIDEVGIWSRALSSTEISQLYNSGNGRAYPLTTFNPAWARGSNVLIGSAA